MSFSRSFAARVSSFGAVLVLSCFGLVSWSSRSVSAWGGSVRPLCWESEGPCLFPSESFVPLVGAGELWSLVFECLRLR